MVNVTPGEQFNTEFASKGHRLAFTTLGCPEWSWRRILDEAQRMGYSGIEVRGVDGEMDLPSAAPFLSERQAETRAELSRRNLSICCLGSSVRFEDPDAMEENVQSGKAYIDLAAALDVPYVRVFGDKIRHPDLEEQVVAQVVEGLNALGAYAEGKSVTVIIESHGDFSRSSRLEGVMARIEHETVGVLWDLHHPWRFYDEPLDETFNRLRPWIRHVHFKDSIQVDDGIRYSLLGEGDFPVSEALALLEEADYRGWLSFEWEKKWHPEIEPPEIALPHFVEAVRSQERAAG